MYKYPMLNSILFLSIGVFYISSASVIAQIEHVSIMEMFSKHSVLMMFVGLYIALVHYMVYHSIMSAKKERELKNQLAISSSVFEHAKEGIVIANIDNKIIDANPEFTAITGYRKSEVIGIPAISLASEVNKTELLSGLTESLQKKGSWHGEVWKKNKDGRNYLVEMKASLVRGKAGSDTFYIYVFMDITLPNLQKEQLKKMVHYDNLTSLPNREFLKGRLVQAMADAIDTSTFLFVCSLDLDGFKMINDVLGREFGDAVLIKLSQKLEKFAGSKNVARMGGDEFTLLFGGIKDRDDVHALIEDLQTVVQSPCLAGVNVVKPTASIGVAIYPEDGSDAETLVRHADSAMFDSKVKGKNQYSIFDSQQKKSVTMKNELISQMLKAIRSDEMTLYYQPKMDILTSEILGFEALIRWIHPKNGLMLPDSFLSCITGNNSIIELDKWVLNQAFCQLREWKANSFETIVSINITCESILNPDFIETVEAFCQEYADVDPSKLQFEVLETSLLKDMSFAKAQLTKIRELGISVALDDFGTGYSSLGYLRNLPTDFIKIDQSFVRGILNDEGDLAIVSGIIQLSKVFGMKVVAEGVEDVFVFEKLKELGCDIAQGYFLSKPMPATDVTKWLIDKTWSILR